MLLGIFYFFAQLECWGRAPEQHRERGQGCCGDDESAEGQAVSSLECIRVEYGKLLELAMLSSRSPRMCVRMGMEEKGWC